MNVRDKSSPVRIILFDAVGTLLRPSPPVAEAYHRAALQYGTTKSIAEVHERFAAALKRYAPYGIQPITEVGPRPLSRRVPLTTNEQREFQRWRSIVSYVFDDVATHSHALFRALWDHFATAANWQLFDDVAPVWQALADSGFRLGLASNFDARLVNVCRGLPPLNSADFCFVSSSLRYPKPHPRFYLEIQRRLGLPAHQLMLVGDDRENDVDAPRAAGWRAVHLCRDAIHGQDSISSLHELLRFLEN